MSRATVNCRNILSRSWRLLIFTYILLGMCYTGLAQKTKVQIVTADSLVYDEKFDKDAKRLLGNVQFRHENAILFCDSAHFNSRTNIIIAFNNIRMLQGDSLTLKGDNLTYDGNQKMAQMRGDVTLVHKSTELKTHFLDYDRNKNIGYYYNKGVITDKENTLKSEKGKYFAQTRDYYATDSVSLTNKKYIMFSDTLRYNTQTKISYFYGPTVIRGDSNLIYCENGWYNTVTEISQYNKNAYLVNGAQTLKGDSLYYDRNKSLGKAYKNVILNDTAQKVILKGEYGFYLEKPEKALITGKTELIKIEEKDSLFLHADTLRSDLDTATKKKILRAYKKVKVFKSDLQGKCDSLVFNLNDSTITMLQSPVVWSEGTQLTADSIKIFSKNQQVCRLELYNTALIISLEDSIKYNQMKGKIITGYVKDNELYKIDIFGNAQSVYYPKDGKDLVGMNKAESSNMVIYRKDKKFEKIIFESKPDATLFPIQKVAENDMYLKGFQWLEKHRPKKRDDIFSWEIGNK